MVLVPGVHARFLVCLFVLPCYASYLRLAFIKTSVSQGQDIVVTWTLDQPDTPQFTLSLLSQSGNGDTTISNQTVTTNGGKNGQISFSSKSLVPGHCYLEAPEMSFGGLGVLAVVGNSQSQITTSSSSQPVTASQSSTTVTSNTDSTSITSLPIPGFSTALSHTPSQTSNDNPTLQPTSTTSSSLPDDTHTSKLGVILGSVLGALALVAILVAVLFFWRRRRAQQQTLSTNLDPFPQNLKMTISSVTTVTTGATGSRARHNDASGAGSSPIDSFSTEVLSRNRQLEEEVRWWRTRYTEEYSPGAPPGYPGSEPGTDPGPSSSESSGQRRRRSEKSAAYRAAPRAAPAADAGIVKTG